MISSEVQRTLVKSPPELWAELSDPASLARHLGELGEIRITRTEPERTVEWEAADTTGKVLLKASGWGTKVTLTAAREVSAPEPIVEPQPEVEPEPVVEPTPEPRRGFFARVFGRRQKVEPVPEPEPPFRRKLSRTLQPSWRRSRSRWPQRPRPCSPPCSTASARRTTGRSRGPEAALRTTPPPPPG